MPDLIKELKEALVDGVRRLITADQAAKQFLPSPPGRTVGTGIAFAGASGTRDDNRVATGYDPATGLTTVVVTLDASIIDGDDVWSM